jgi:predicted nucleotidyltransferase
MDELEKFKLFEMKTLEDLRRWNGLRNVLVHKYNEIENEIIFKNKAQVIKTLKDFVKKAEEIIDERIFKSNIIKNDLSFVKEYWAIMYGSYVDENYISGRSDIDVAIISQSKVREKNKELFDSLLPNIIPPYDIKVFELLPLYLQMEIINNYEVLFGDPLEISEYLYQFRKIWKDMKNRIENNRFNTIKEKIELIERRKEILEKI